MRNTIIFYFFALILGLLALGRFLHWSDLEPNFFHVRFIELIQVLTVLVVAYFINYNINKKTTFSVKQREILFDLISHFQDELAATLAAGYDFINVRGMNKDLTEQSKINIKFKYMSILLGTIQKAEKPHTMLNNYNLSLHTKFRKFKQAMTDRPFSGSTHDNESELLVISETYASLLNELHKYKLALYS